MRQHVTVVPADRLIIVDGIPLRFDFPYPDNLTAIQWHDGSGHMEWSDDINHPLPSEAYDEEVAPYVELWEQEQARLIAEANATETARLAEYNSSEARGDRIRVERDRRLTASDRYALPDYPHANEAMRQAWLAYRQALRNVPDQKGFPWTGPEDSAVPWPVEPA